jgi:DNA-binding transcriptional MerR regulator
MAYTVKQLARLAGVSVRTLHHYDELGLLPPPVIGANGYRYYDERSVLRLQSILFYRELGFPLAKIREALDRPGFDAIAALQEHRVALESRVGRLQRLIATIDHTVCHLKGEKTMNTKQLFAGFTPEEEQKYADEAAQRWDEGTVRESQRRWNARSPESKQAVKAEAEAIYRDLITAMPLGADSVPVQACIERWRRHIGHFWTPNDEQCLGLAALYRDDPAFRRNYDAMHPQLANFMCEAVKVHVDRRRASAPKADRAPSR